MFVDLKAKRWDRSNQVVEDVCHQRFERCPVLVFGEAVKFHRYALRCGLKVSHQQRHLLVDFRVVSDVAFRVVSEEAQVGEAAAVDVVRYGVSSPTGIVRGNHGLPFLNPSGEDLDTPEGVDELFVSEMNGGGADGDGALHAAAARLAHPTPILE